MTRYRCLVSGINVTCLASLGRGGEGEVFTTDAPGMVAKIYHPHRLPGPEMIAKLRYMLGNPPEQPPSADNHAAITWPHDLLVGRGNVVQGFVMDVSAGEALDKAVTPLSRKRHFPGHSWRHSLAIAHNLSWIMANIHAKGYVIGDISEQNFRVLPNGVASIIDTDSFQICDAANRKVYPCKVMTPDFAAPELTNEMMIRGERRADQDCFSLAVIIHRLLMCGNHPFSGVYRQDGEPPDLRTSIVNGFTVFDPNGPYAPRPKAPPMDMLPESFRNLFERAFVRGHRDASARPTALEWKDALAAVLGAPEGLRDCAVNPVHVYPGHLSACPWCGLYARQQIEYYDPRVAAPRTQSNRPRTFAPQRQRAQVQVPVSGMQIQAAVQPLAGVQPAQSAPPPLSGQPTVPFASTRQVRRERSTVGNVVRVVLALAFIALPAWLNFSSVVWPLPPFSWKGIKERAVEVQYQLYLWIKYG